MIRTKPMIVAPPTELRDEWATPPKIFDALNRKFHFSLDPCSTSDNRKTVYHFTKEHNGLWQSWSDENVFCNPPYSRGNIDLWVKKCYDESQSARVIALLPVSTSSDWFQKYCIGQTLYFVDKRIRFVGAPFTAPFSSVIVHFNGHNRVETFKQ